MSFALGATAQTVTGSGATDSVPVFTGSSMLGNSIITQSGSNVGIGTTSPLAPLDVVGYLHVSGNSSPPTTEQGAYLGWNALTGGYGETDFINNQGGGPGGFAFMNTPSSGSPQSTLMFLNGAGNVGIGTTSPNELLQVGATYSQNPSIMVGGADNNNSSTGRFALLFGAYRDVETIESGIVATPTWICCGGYPASGYAGIRVNSLGFYTEYDASNPTNYSPNMLINPNGYVGIGTSSPGAQLEVNGNVKLTSGSGASITFQDGSIQSTAYTGVTCGGDYAESVDVTGSRTQYEPGDVLVLDTENPGRVLKSFEAYSTTVSGIYSTKPGVVGRRQTSDPKTTKTEVPMAMVGVVPTKVSAENGAIKVGDLLVSSSTVGYAMKGTDRSKMLGAVIGKAMGNLNAGMGMIEVLVTLQ
jgi:hypothetical protein